MGGHRVIKELIKLANHLDSKGFAKEADYLDGIIRRANMKLFYREGDKKEFFDSVQYRNYMEINIDSGLEQDPTLPRVSYQVGSGKNDRESILYGPPAIPVDVALEAIVDLHDYAVEAWTSRGRINGWELALLYKEFPHWMQAIGRPVPPTPID